MSAHSDSQRRRRRPVLPLSRCLLLASLVFSLGCPAEPEAPSTGPEPRRGSESSSYEVGSSKPPVRRLDSTSLRNMSELLAGVVPEGEEDRLDPVWAAHAEAMVAIWNQMDPRLEAMRAWSDQHLASAASATAPLVYPFGGPDLISAIQFFPDASLFILLGLEAPGRLPMPEEFSGKALAEDLERLRRPFHSMVESGYFVRNDIDKDLSGGHFDGLLPLILIGLVHAGQVPIGLEYVTLDPETVQVVPLPPEADDASAVKVSFVDRASADRMDEARRTGRDLAEDERPKARSVYYFARDLSNQGLYTDDPFGRLLERQKAINVYIKGGEYLLHLPSFSNLGKLILAESQIVLQDDSGLPIRQLKSDRWNIRLFGQYSDILAAYKKWFQEDLAAAYAKSDRVEPLPFNLGYNSTNDGGCLILAERRPDEGAPDPQTTAADAAGD